VFNWTSFIFRHDCKVLLRVLSKSIKKYKLLYIILMQFNSKLNLNFSTLFLAMQLS